MTADAVTFTNGHVFDGERLLSGHAARYCGGLLAQIEDSSSVDTSGEVVDLDGGIHAPAYTDLQVNGGGGVMFNDDPSLVTLERMAAAHRRLGTARILPTLITDTRDKTTAAIAAAVEAVRQDTDGIAGLHLEGPHLSVARKGAHDGALIRPMEPADVEQLVEARSKLPALMVTVAPESVSVSQVRSLSEAGVIVSLGHSDSDFDTCSRYARAGARCATHIFNAMSPLQSREPGLVGTALSDGGLSAGLIADGIHVHPETMRIAWQSKNGPGRIFLVSDAMAVAGSDLTEFCLGGRTIQRRGGRLTLSDGTLAGADLDLTQAVRTLVNDSRIDLAQALRAATSTPAALIGESCGLLTVGQTRLADTICLTRDLVLRSPPSGALKPNS